VCTLPVTSQPERRAVRAVSPSSLVVVGPASVPRLGSNGRAAGRRAGAPALVGRLAAGPPGNRRHRRPRGRRGPIASRPGRRR
jgi:hypothetical protein